jgi:hypothetical protein
MIPSDPAAVISFPLLGIPLCLRAGAFLNLLDLHNGVVGDAGYFGNLFSGINASRRSGGLLPLPKFVIVVSLSQLSTVL